MALAGLSGVKRTSKDASKQIQGYEGPAKRGSAAAKDVAKNASFDNSPFQSLGKSLLEGKLR